MRISGILSGHEVFRFGRVPSRIDLMTHVKGLEFENAFQNARQIDVDNIKIRVLHLHDLIQAKKASNRHKDLDDIEHLTEN